MGCQQIQNGAVQVLGAELKIASESGQRFLPDESCTLAINRQMGRYLLVVRNTTGMEGQSGKSVS
jgi:hypothetical protein